MFHNRQKYNYERELLARLKSEVANSHNETYRRVTKDFNGIEDYELSQYIWSKFHEYGFGYPSTNTQILRCVGQEHALQTLNRYGGKNYNEAYFNKFRREYESSPNRIYSHNRLQHELFLAEQDKQKAYEQLLAKKQESFREDLFGRKDPFNGFQDIDDRKNKRKMDGKGSGDSSDGDDDDGQDGDKDRTQKAMRKFIQKEMKKYMVFAGKMDDDDQDNAPHAGQKVVIETPRQNFEKDAYKERSMFLDPLSGKYKLGYDNVDSTFIQQQMNDPSKNSMITSSVDALRAGTNKSILRNDRKVRSKLVNMIEEKERKRTEGFNLDQHGNFLEQDRKSSEGEKDQDLSATDFEGQSLGDVFSTRHKNRDEDLDWDDYTATYTNGGDYPDEDNFGGGVSLRLTGSQQQQDNQDYNDGDDEDEHTESQEWQHQSRVQSPQPISRGMELRFGSAMQDILGMMDSEGYDEGQIQDFLENMSVNREEFKSMPMDMKISEITKTLKNVDSVHGLNPPNSSMTASDKIEVYRERRLRKHSSRPVNLISDVFAKDKSLNALNNLTVRLKQSPPRVQSPVRDVESTDPGEPDDPYRDILTDEEEQIVSSSTPDDDDDVNSGTVQLDEELNHRTLEYAEKFDERLNQFVGSTPMQEENAVALNQFLRQVVNEDPRELAKQEKRREEELELANRLKNNYNPNVVPVKDAHRYNSIETGGYTVTGPEIRFRREVVLDEQQIDEARFETTDENGKPSVVKAVESAINEVTSNEESTMGGMLGNSNGTKTFKDFTTNDYYHLVGVESDTEFQRMHDEKIDGGDISKSVLNDFTKLNFLPGERRPTMNTPPLSLLPTDNAQKIIGAKPLFGGLSDEQNKELDSESPAKMISMEVDQNLANTSEQSIIADTTVNDVNVIVEDHKETSYAHRIGELQTVRDRAMYVVKMMVRDALQIGRIDQTMLQNKEVVKICHILTQAIEILLSRQSSYFSDFNDPSHQLELINVETIANAEYGYFSLLQGGQFLCNLLEVSRNVFNFKMEAITESQFRAVGNEETPRIRVFKEFLYYVMCENQIVNPDDMIVFRSETRFRQSAIIRYQSLDPQMKTKHFFLMLENYLLQLFVSGNTSVDQSLKFYNLLESDLHRRFNAVLINYMANVNATIERLLAKSTFALLFTESEQRIDNARSLSYRRAAIPILNNMFGNPAVSDFDTNSENWNMIFHSRDADHFKDVLEADLPPNGDTMKRLINSYRDYNFSASTSGVGGHQWAELEPTKLMDVLINLFVEHEIIPPLTGSYKRSLSNFFSVLMADPIHQMFVKHLKPLYRRGWRKQNLVRQACFIVVEHYVGLVMLIVQRALMQNNSEMSNTASFMSTMGGFRPMMKLQDVLRELIMAFDPIAYLADEIGNRDSHEAKFQHHFKRYNEHVEEIIRSYELWLQDQVDGYNLPQSTMSRADLFARINSAGGFEESRDLFLEGMRTEIVEADEVTMVNQPVMTEGNRDKRLDEDGIPMREVGITIKNVGSQTMGVTEANATQPIEVKIDRNDEKTTVNVDASHPQVQGMSNVELMNSIRTIMKEELSINVRQVAVPMGNDQTNSSTNNRSYVAYASDENYGDLAESVIGNYDDQETLLYNFSVQPEDSASQIASTVNYQPPQSLLSNDAITVDYNAPNSLAQPDLAAPGEIILTTESPDSASLVSADSRRPAVLSISEPAVITAIGGNVSSVLQDNSVVETVTEEIDVNGTPGKLISDDLSNRIQLLQDDDERFYEDELTLLSHNSADGREQIEGSGVQGELHVDTIHGIVNENESSIPNNEKDIFSASKSVDESSLLIDKTIAKIKADAESKIRAKLLKYEKEVTSKKKKEMKTKLAKKIKEKQKKKKSNFKDVLPPIVGKNQANIVERDVQFLKQRVTLPTKTSKNVEKRARKEIELTDQEKDLNNRKVKRIALKTKQIRIRKKKPQTQRVVPPQPKKPKQEQREDALIKEKYSIEKRLERMERNRPEILVTKPLPRNSPFLYRTGKDSTYRSTKGKKRTLDELEEDDDYFSELSIIPSDVPSNQNQSGAKKKKPKK